MNILFFIENLQIIFVFLVLVVSFYLYTSGKLPIDIVSGWVLILLVLFFYLFPVYDEIGNNKLDFIHIFKSFINPAVITIISLMIIGFTMGETGTIENIASKITKNKKTNPFLILTVILIAVGFLSAFLNNVPVVVIFIPVIISLTTKLKQSPTKWLLPLSYVTILGGMTTLVGSSTNLVISGAISQTGEEPFTFFSFTTIGLLLAFFGFIYSLLILPRLLPKKKPLRNQIQDEENERKFFANIKVNSSSPISGKIINGWKIEGYDAEIIALTRNNDTIERPFDNRVVLPNDDILVLSDRENLLLFASGDIENMTDHDIIEGEEQLLAEIIISNKSPFIGKSLREIQLTKKRQLVPVGIERNSGILQNEIMDIKLRLGDLLLVVGSREKISAIMDYTDFILVQSSSDEIRHRHHTFHTMIIFILTIIAISTNILPTVIATLIGAMVMISTGCISFKKAIKSIDTKIIMLLASTLSLGLALQETGGAMLIADIMLYALDGFSPAIILSIFFLIIVVMTNVLSNQATAVIFTPISISIAKSLYVDINAFTFAVIFAANCCFITPFAYQTNLLIMTPGQYKVMDFVKFGTPLAILIWMLYSIVAPIYFGF